MAYDGCILRTCSEYLKFCVGLLSRYRLRHSVAVVGMISRPTVSLFDKIVQIYNWLITDPKCTQTVTTKAIERVLRHKFNNFNNISYRDVEVIGHGLRSPLLKDTIVAILKLSDKFDEELTFSTPPHASNNTVESKHENRNLRICA